MIEVKCPETGLLAYHLSPLTPVYRFEPRDIATPMTPHDSPYAPWGPYEFGYRHLFVAERQALDDLEALRRSQNYFVGEVVLRHEILVTLLRRCGPRTAVLEDVKFNGTVLGEPRKGGLIIAAPI